MSRDRSPAPTLRPLAADYWPAGTRRPVPRLALALLGAPLALGAALGLLTYAAYALGANTPGDPLAQAAHMATSFWKAFAPLTLLVGAPAIALLWSLRLRSMGAWLLAGLITGGAAAAVQAVSSGAAMITEAAPLIVMGAPLLLMVRWIAGVRARP